MTRDATDRLAELFLHHPAWIAASKHITAAATSTVFFSHRPGETWHLEHSRGETRLLPGAAKDPDFIFRFTPASVECLEAVQGGIGEFAVELFALILEEDPEKGAKLRIVSKFPRLFRRGYVGLLVAAGPKLAVFGATHGIRTLNALRRLILELRSREPAEWETEIPKGTTRDQ